MITGSINNKPFSFAACWEELSTEKALKIALLMYAEPQSAALDIKILRVIFTVSNKLFNSFTDEEIWQLIQQTKWVWALPEKVKMPFKYFTHNNVRYYTPSNNFENGTFGEFVAANLEFMQYVNPTTPDYDAPRRLVAILCRPKTRQDTTDPTWNGDYREAFHSEICKNRADELLTLQPGVLILVINYWIKLLEGIAKQYPIFDDKQGPPDGGMGWVNTMFSVAEEGTFGSVKEIESAFFHKICLYLVKKKRDHEKAEAEIEAAKNQ